MWFRPSRRARYRRRPTASNRNRSSQPWCCGHDPERSGGVDLGWTGRNRADADTGGGRAAHPARYLADATPVRRATNRDDLGRHAQGRPGGSTASTSPTEVAGTTGTSNDGCAGFEEYQAAFDDAYTNAAIANPEALAFLLEAQNNPEVPEHLRRDHSGGSNRPERVLSSLADGIAVDHATRLRGGVARGADRDLPRAERIHRQYRIAGAYDCLDAGVSRDDDLSARAMRQLLPLMRSAPDLRLWANGEEPE